jgi:hypothetical protein
MIEKQEADGFDDEDETLDDGGDEVDLARLSKDMDQARRRGVKQGEPAWRRLELLAEQKRTAELTSDFEDYDLEDGRRGKQASLRL